MNQERTDESLRHRSVLERSLRRRLWKALQEEDAITAMSVYTATKVDYETWLEKELCEEYRMKMIEAVKSDVIDVSQHISDTEGHGKVKTFVQRTKVSFTNPLKCMSTCKRNKAIAMRNLSSAESLKAKLLDDGGDIDPTLPILLSRLHPNDELCTDDFYDPYDSYDLELLFPEKTDSRKDHVLHSGREPLLAGLLRRNSSLRNSFNHSHDIFSASNYPFGFSGEASTHRREEKNKVDKDMTTLMHEVCRLASPEFVRLLLQNGGNPNFRNGLDRTALHMVVGGVSNMENRNSELESGGIRKSIVIPSADEIHEDKSKRSFMTTRILNRFLPIHNDRNNQKLPVPMKIRFFKPDDEDNLQAMEFQRMDALLAILSWYHPDDGTSAAGEGPTINSVDFSGRTALHYAAELGRIELCFTLLNNFGILLTLVDEAGKTPCELAAERNYSELASQLEARAILYTDPYDFEDDYPSVTISNEQISTDSRKSESREQRVPQSNLVAPFSWFETWTIGEVRSERHRRIASLCLDMQSILKEKQEKLESFAFMFNVDVEDIEELKSSSTVEIDPLSDEKSNATNSNDSFNGLKTSKIEVESSPREYCDSESLHCMSMKENASSKREPSNQEDFDHNGDAPTNDTERFIIGEDSTTIKVTPDEPLHNIKTLSRNLHNQYVEKFAVYHSWDTDAAIQAFKEDPIEAVRIAGLEAILKEESPKPIDGKSSPEESICLICCDDIPSSEKRVKLRSCEHFFCSDCLGDYILDFCNSRESGGIVKCPHHNCSAVMELEELERLAPNHSVLESLMNTSDETFVVSALDFAFCPYPDCQQVVRRVVQSKSIPSNVDVNLVNLCGAVCSGLFSEMSQVESQEICDVPLTYDGVHDANYRSMKTLEQPKQSHRFCFTCFQPMHWPLQCDTLGQWKGKIAEELSELEHGKSDDNNFNEVAQQLWMKANTRPCPKCKAPIEKDDGCNHMTCSNRNCRHEFCWICREDWKLHNTETGGFFRCNRWQSDNDHEFNDPKSQRESPSGTNDPSSDENYGTAFHASRVALRKANEMGLFLHHYRRWNGHMESLHLEKKMASNVCDRFTPVIKAAIEFIGDVNFDFGGKGLSFIHDAFVELFECRSFLQHSYAFAFFRYPMKFRLRRDRIVGGKEREKLTFELLQSELEMVTEQLSDIVARKHLRATQKQISILTENTSRKRIQFTSFLLSVLNEQAKEEVRAEKRSKRMNDRSTSDLSLNDVDGNTDNFDFRIPSSRLFHQFYRHRNILSPRYGRRIENYSSDVRRIFGDVEDDYPGIFSGFANESNSSFESASEEGQFSLGPRFQGRPTHEHHPSRLQHWSCQECTFMNLFGQRCAMCGTFRR